MLTLLLATALADEPKPWIGKQNSTHIGFQVLPADPFFTLNTSSTIGFAPRRKGRGQDKGWNIGLATQVGIGFQPGNLLLPATVYVEMNAGLGAFFRWDRFHLDQRIMGGFTYPYLTQPWGNLRYEAGFFGLVSKNRKIGVGGNFVMDVTFIVGQATVLPGFTIGVNL